MSGFNHSFKHFLRTGHFISDNTPVTSRQLTLILDYIQTNPTLLNSLPHNQSLTLVATPTKAKINEKDCSTCTTEIKLKEINQELEEKVKACEEKMDKLYQSAVERLLMFEPHPSPLATPSEGDTENKQSNTPTTCLSKP